MTKPLSEFGFFLTKSLYLALPDSLKWRLARKLRSLARLFCKNIPEKIVVLKDLKFTSGSNSKTLKIKIRPSELIGSHIAFEGNYEPGLLNLLKEHLSPGDHFLDIGTNIGYFSLAAASLVGKEGKVSGVEASVTTFNNLKENVKLNNLEEVIEVHNIAAWSKNTKLRFNVAETGKSGMSSLRPLGQKAKEIEVSAKKLDNVIDFKASPVKAIKLDIEGAELEALRGMNKLITTNRPLIFLELSPKYLAELGSSKNSLLSLLENDLQYKIYSYDSKGRINNFINSEPGEEQINIFAKSKLTENEIAKKTL